MANYHVDYINGSDATGNGTAANPWGTASYALAESSAGAGDVIKVAGSALTTVDTTATLNASNAKQIMTTTDLTSQIAVGDLVQISPNGVADYANWPTQYVSAIDATSINLFEDIYMPGDWRTGTNTYTIQTIGDTFTTTASSVDLFPNGVGADAIVEGGYDATFTSIIGLTRFRRGGIGPGSQSGFGFDIKTSSQTVGGPIFKNFSFAQFNRSWNTEFGASHRADNLHSYGAGGRGFAYYGTICSVTPGGAAPKLYYSGSTGEHNIVYFGNFWQAGYTPDIEAYVYISLRGISNNNDANFTKLVFWNPGQQSNGEEFGNTLNIEGNSNTLGFKNTEYLTNLIENNRGGYGGTRQNVTLFQNCNGTLSSLTLLDGNTTEDYWYTYMLFGENTQNGRCTVKLPTGTDLTNSSISHHLAGTRAPAITTEPAQKILIDDNYSWMSMAGTLQATDNVNYDTGTSSRVIVPGSRMRYAGVDPRVLLAQVTKTTATPPSTITVRYKLEATSGSYGTRLYFANSSQVDLTTGNQQMTADGTWRDATFQCFTLTDQRFATYWNDIPVGGTWMIDFTFLYYGTDPDAIWIDSVTVNY